MHISNSPRKDKPLTIDGEALARAARNPTKFNRAIAWHRARGVTDGELVKALAAARTLIRPTGHR
jgi:hypothetical protein